MGSNPDRRRVIHTPEPVATRAPWNSSNVARPGQTPRSVFLDTATDDNNPARHTLAVPSNSRSINTSDTRPSSATKKVVYVPSVVTEEPVRRSPVYVHYPQTNTYPVNSKFVRTDGGGKSSLLDIEIRRFLFYEYMQRFISSPNSRNDRGATAANRRRITIDATTVIQKSYSIDR